MNLSDADKKNLSASEQSQIKKYKSDWQAAYEKGDKAGMDAAHAGAEAIRSGKGYSGGADGSGYFAPGNSYGGGMSADDVRQWAEKYEYDNLDAQSGWINGFSHAMNQRSMANFIRQQMQANSDAWASADEAGKAYLHDQNLQLAKVLQDHLGGVRSEYNAELGRWETDNPNLGYGYNLKNYEDEAWYKTQYGMTDEQLDKYRYDTDRYRNFVDQDLIRNWIDESSGYTGQYAQFVNGPYGQLLMGTNGVAPSTYIDLRGDGFADEFDDVAPPKDAEGNIIPRAPFLKHNNNMEDYTKAADRMSYVDENGVIRPGKMVETNPGGADFDNGTILGHTPASAVKQKSDPATGTLEQWQQSAMEQVAAQRDHAVDMAVQQLLQAQQEGEKLQQERLDQIAREERNSLDNSALYAETRGDRGGIGKSQYDRIQAQADANRQAVADARMQLATDTAQQIAKLRAEGEFEKADDMMEVSQAYLLKLLELEKWAAEYGLDVAKFKQSIREWEKEYQLSLAKMLI